uniref:Zf-C3HC4_2 and Pfam-B_7383 and Pfam-B_16880 and Pfam-B_12017 and Pfam-B_10913 and Pfam-B_2478 and Pfam-B_3518 and Pfam-B_6278 domain containing protein n=1 Tax=Echinococcus granulosus TaxID=6210 RepID=A0A068WC89_ECHGR|nr:zf-C3HC4_2 and Pfam-B_7383 and Pfam-B_16880 and Pfam-B_12017 and Pfam-B_10913 and Pfam-B_2478 and Pfam-B_3518 and Pfam-B_6278 domain containing protein [Echinococcus granulosus]
MPPCQHVFCYPCISRYIQKSEAKCPICRTAFSKEDLRRSLQIEQLLSAKNNEPVPPCESDGYPKSFDFSSKPRSQQQVDRSKWVTTLAAGAAGVLIGVIGAALQCGFEKEKVERGFIFSY